MKHFLETYIFVHLSLRKYSQYTVSKGVNLFKDFDTYCSQVLKDTCTDTYFHKSLSQNAPFLHSWKCTLFFLIYAGRWTLSYCFN